MPMQDLKRRGGKGLRCSTIGMREGVGEDGMAERDGMSDADLTTSPMP
jgi:hypothetical protein